MHHNTTITPATQKDYDALCACDPYAQTHPERRKEIAHAIDTKTCFVAQKDDLIVGYIISDRTFYGQPFIWSLMIHPQYRHEGIGAALMRYIETHASGEKLFTSTNQSNLPMQHLCEKLGFTKSGIIENLDEGDPEIVYFKRLAGREAK